MPAQQAFWKAKNNFALGTGFFKGLYALVEGTGTVGDRLDFEVCTGTTRFADIPAVAGTYPLIQASDFGAGLDVTNLALYVNGTVAWAGGTAGTVSLSIVGTDGTVIATFTQAALAASAPGAPMTYSISTGSTQATGVTDNLIRTIGQTVASGVGINAVVANSTSGSPVRLRLTGRAIP